ncbi:hypothetical protein HDK90DRAFT_122948 [Phyllosticta capitalensis]|uniref:Uncharacterized protein n=1 Tax=Phyllosticta capitalensis TaxID=121624 RepID=A0ABR1YY12_9PEZI
MDASKQASTASTYMYIHVVINPSTHAPIPPTCILPCPALPDPARLKHGPGLYERRAGANGKRNKRQTGGGGGERAGQGRLPTLTFGSWVVATEVRAGAAEIWGKTGKWRGDRQHDGAGIAEVSLTSFFPFSLRLVVSLAKCMHAAAWMVDAKVPGHWQLRIRFNAKWKQKHTRALDAWMDGKGGVSRHGVESWEQPVPLFSQATYGTGSVRLSSAGVMSRNTHSRSGSKN